MDGDTCVCGDVLDEHGNDPNHPGSTACDIAGCGCLNFEADDEDTEEE